MGYTAYFRPGMEDLNPDRTVKNRSLLRMCEDTAGFHTDSVGDGLTVMDRTGYAWILLAWQLQVYERPCYGQKLTVSTWPRQMARVHAWRDFAIKDEQGQLLAEATSKWIVVSALDHAVMKIPAHMADLYPEEPGGGLSGWRPARPAIPERAEREEIRTIRRSRTDMLGHLHNLCYLDLAEDLLPESAGAPGRLNHVTIQYKTEIRADEDVRLMYCAENGRYAVTVAGEGGLCAQIEMW